MSRKKRKQWESIPVPSPSVYEVMNDGRSVLSYPRLRLKWLPRLVFPFHHILRAHLCLTEEERMVWETIDGVRSIRTIAIVLAPYLCSFGDQQYEDKIIRLIQRFQREGFVWMKFESFK